MRKSTICGVLLSVALGFVIAGITLADGAGKGCSIQGSWFGVVGLGDTRLTGWIITVLILLDKLTVPCVSQVNLWFLIVRPDNTSLHYQTNPNHT